MSNRLFFCEETQEKSEIGTQRSPIKVQQRDSMWIELRPSLAQRDLEPGCARETLGLAVVMILGGFCLLGLMILL